MRIFSHVTLLPAAALLSSAFARSAAAERDAAASAELARAFGAFFHVALSLLLAPYPLLRLSAHLAFH